MRGAWGPGIRLPRSLLRACPGDLRGASGPEDRLVFSLSRASSRLSLPASGSECNSSAETPSCGLRAIELCASSSMSVPGWVRYGSRAWAGLVQRGSGVCFAAGTSRGKTPRCAPKPPPVLRSLAPTSLPPELSNRTGIPFPSLPFPPAPQAHFDDLGSERDRLQVLQKRNRFAVQTRPRPAPPRCLFFFFPKTNLQKGRCSGVLSWQQGWPGRSLTSFPGPPTLPKSPKSALLQLEIGGGRWDKPPWKLSLARTGYG